MEESGRLNGLLRSLAGMPGAREEHQPSVRFDVSRIQEAMDHIKRLGGNGVLTVNFANGKATGYAQWRPSQSKS